MFFSIYDKDKTMDSFFQWAKELLIEDSTCREKVEQVHQKFLNIFKDEAEIRKLYWDPSDDMDSFKLELPSELVRYVYFHYISISVNTNFSQLEDELIQHFPNMMVGIFQITYVNPVQGNDFIKVFKKWSQRMLIIVLRLGSGVIGDDLTIDEIFEHLSPNCCVLIIEGDGNFSRVNGQRSVVDGTKRLFLVTLESPCPSSPSQVLDMTQDFDSTQEYLDSLQASPEPESLQNGDPDWKSLDTYQIEWKYNQDWSEFYQECMESSLDPPSVNPTTQTSSGIQ